jgi:hypothetical protein
MPDRISAEAVLKQARWFGTAVVRNAAGTKVDHTGR